MLCWLVPDIYQISTIYFERIWHLKCFYLLHAIKYIWIISVSLLAHFRQLMEIKGTMVAVVTPLLPISEIGVRFPARPQVGKLVVACRWSAVYSTEP